MYLDLTDGLNGGDWKLVTEWKDDGNWTVPPTYVPCIHSFNNEVIIGI